MYKHLDMHVVGQHRAKMVLSVAMYNHYKKLNFMLSAAELDTDESDSLDEETSKQILF